MRAMSAGRQHRGWSDKPTNRALMEKTQKAHFHHYMGGDDYGLTYQSCRFCGEACFRSKDQEHGDCYIRVRTFEDCRGLWKYGVRHYLCSECRKNVMLGIAPKRAV